jgi:hypothetical protein
MKTFIWKYGRAEAQQGYNDDLIMSFGIGLYVRDTALKFRQHGVDVTKAALGSFHKSTTSYQGAYFSTGQDNPYHMETEKVELRTLVGFYNIYSYINILWLIQPYLQD